MEVEELGLAVKTSGTLSLVLLTGTTNTDVACVLLTGTSLDALADFLGATALGWDLDLDGGLFSVAMKTLGTVTMESMARFTFTLLGGLGLADTLFTNLPPGVGTRGWAHATETLLTLVVTKVTGFTFTLLFLLWLTIRVTTIAWVTVVWLWGIIGWGVVCWGRWVVWSWCWGVVGGGWVVVGRHSCDESESKDGLHFFKKVFGSRRCVDLV